jgi:hypothetical protein
VNTFTLLDTDFLLLIDIIHYNSNLLVTGQNQETQIVTFKGHIGKAVKVSKNFFNKFTFLFHNKIINSTFSSSQQMPRSFKHKQESKSRLLLLLILWKHTIRLCY